MNTIFAVDRGLAKAETVLLVIFLGTMVVLAFAQVVLRNVFGTGLVWGDTIVRHMVLWAGFVGGALAAFEGRHISIDALTKFLSVRVKHAAAAITHLFGGIVCYYLAVASWTFLTAEMDAGGEFVLGLPGWTAMAIIPAGYVMIMLHFFLKVIEHAWWTVHPPAEGGVSMGTWLIAAGFALLALFGAPLFTIIGATAMLAFTAQEIDASAVIVELYRICSNPTLVAIPLFTFAGHMLAESKAPTRLVNLARALFGWIPGGLGVVALITCAVFTAFTGASGVTIVALGGLLYPILISEKYDERFSLGLVTTSGSLGLLFPPSLPLILYAVIAKISVDQLFTAGIIPGIILVVALAAYSIQHGVTKKVPRTPFTLRAVGVALKATAWEVPLPVLVIGGIYTGMFTATEAAAVTAFYVLIVEVFVYRDIKLFSDVPRVMRESMLLVGAILMIIGTAMGLTNYLVDEEVPMQLFEYTKTFIDSPVLFLVVLNLFLIVVGMMMDIFSAIIVVVPLVIPIARAYGIDPVHLGIIFLANLEIGYLTPPVGLNLFISSLRFHTPVFTVVRSVIPFTLILLAALLLITYVPELSLFLVHALGVQ